MPSSPRGGFASKWIRVLWRCWNDRQPCDEAGYLLALQKCNTLIVPLRFALREWVGQLHQSRPHSTMFPLEASMMPKSAELKAIDRYTLSTSTPIARPLGRT